MIGVKTGSHFNHARFIVVLNQFNDYVYILCHLSSFIKYLDRIASLDECVDIDDWWIYADQDDQRHTNTPLTHCSFLKQHESLAPSHSPHRLLPRCTCKPRHIIQQKQHRLSQT